MKDSFMTREIDRIDLKMLRLLQDNGRLQPTRNWAQRVDISPRRATAGPRSLFEQGYISRVRAMIAPQKVDRARW